MLNVMYVIILDMLQPDAEVEWFKKDHRISGISEGIALPAMHMDTEQLIVIEGT